MESKIVTVGYGKVKQVKIGEKLPLVFIGGPCAIESHIIMARPLVFHIQTSKMDVFHG